MLHTVSIHPSHTLAHWRTLRQNSLRTGQMNHQFHYASVQQSALWLNVFQKHSPAAQRQTGEQLYRIFAQLVAAPFAGLHGHLVSLGCGEGRKDAVLLEALGKAGATMRWTPMDTSLALVLEAVSAGAKFSAHTPHPLVGDLSAWKDLPQHLTSVDGGAPRLYTFFGMMPNFHPTEVMPLLCSWLRPQDHLFLSANLAPVADESPEAYRTATEKILPQYDNPETARWLTQILRDWGLAHEVENYRMQVEPNQNLLRMVAQVNWRETKTLAWEGELLPITCGQKLQLFFSYRYTIGRLERLLHAHHLATHETLVSESGEEGLWWVRKKSMNV